MKKYIRQWIYEEVNKEIIVEKEYPEIQLNEFEYTIPFKEGNSSEIDRIGIMVSTIFKDELIYQYYVLEKEYFHYKLEIIKEMEEKIRDDIKCMKELISISVYNDVMINMNNIDELKEKLAQLLKTESENIAVEFGYGNDSVTF
jgi:hypothetical protein